MHLFSYCCCHIWIEAGLTSCARVWLVLDLLSALRSSLSFAICRRHIRPLSHLRRLRSYSSSTKHPTIHNGFPRRLRRPQGPRQAAFDAQEALPAPGSASPLPQWRLPRMVWLHWGRISQVSPPLPLPGQHPRMLFANLPYKTTFSNTSATGKSPPSWPTTSNRTTSRASSSIVYSSEPPPEPRPRTAGRDWI